MSDLNIFKNMDEEDKHLFKRCVRELLEKTFIVAEKNVKLYEFVASESKQIDINNYLSAIGYKVVVEDRMKVAMLQQADEDVDTTGLKRKNRYRFNANEIKFLVVLWLLYLERMGYDEYVYVTVGDIIDKCQIYQIKIKPSDFNKLYSIFKKFNLIDYSNDISNEDGKIRLYPSLQFCMDIKQLKKVVSDYTENDIDEEDIEVNEDE